MNDSRVQLYARNAFALRLGRRVVALCVGPEKALFTVHEELLCHAKVFRDVFRPNRKAIVGNCSICHEILDPTTKELTHCYAACGNNFHAECINTWGDHAPSSQTDKCPLCRQTWTSPNLGRTVYSFPNIDAGAFEVYVQWLYSSSIPGGLAGTLLKRAYLLGEDFDDKTFCAEVLRSAIKRTLEVGKCPPPSFVTEVYRDTRPESPLRKLTVGLYAELPREDLDAVFSADAIEWFPSVFLHDFIQALAARRVEPLVDWTDKEGSYNRLTAKLLSRE